MNTFKEKLGVALEKSVDEYNSGMSADDAIVKVARDMNFNTDQTERLVETFNTARTINFYKHASDKTQSFDLADKPGVINSLFGDNITTKKASHELYDYSSYDTPEHDYRRGSLAFSGPSFTDKFSEEALATSAHNYINMCKSASDKAHDTAGMLDANITSSITDLIDGLKRSSDPNGKVAKIRIICGGTPHFDDIFNMFPKSIIDDGLFSKMKSDDVIDDSGVSDVVSKIKDIGSMIGDRDNLESISITWTKKAEDFRNKYLEANGISNKKSNSKKSLSDFVTMHKSAAENDQIRPVLPIIVSDAVSPVFKSKLDYQGSGLHKAIHDIPTKNITADTSNLADYFVEPDTERRKATKVLENMRRGEIINDLIRNDPIISEADPADVATAYNGLIDISPDLSLKKEIVRSILRQSLNSVAMSPYDAKTYLDVNKGINDIKHDYIQRQMRMVGSNDHKK